MKKVELLAPSGNIEKLKYALLYGADAVYIGGENFSLRARSNNFSLKEIEEAVKITHELNKKIYIAVNAFLRNSEIENLKKYLLFLSDIKVDAIIASDPGVIYIAKSISKTLNIHLSTQANTTNTFSTYFWENLGIKRIVLARELSINEITEITNNNKNLEFELFIHGALCISYSGRCFLSTYMTGRDSNKGDCAHPCRWKYKIFLEEETRKNEFFRYEEDSSGAYIFNSNDMCEILKLDKIIESGVSSLKIEGRMKSLYYIINTTRLYRKAIDLYYQDKNLYDKEKINLFSEIQMLNNRGYTEGFYFGTPTKLDYNYDNYSKKVTHFFLAEVKRVISNSEILVFSKNPFSVNETVEIISPNQYEKKLFVIKSIYDTSANEFINTAPSSRELILKIENNKNENFIINDYSIIRKNTKID